MLAKCTGTQFTKLNASTSRFSTPHSKQVCNLIVASAWKWKINKRNWIRNQTNSHLGKLFKSSKGYNWDFDNSR